MGAKLTPPATSATTHDEPPPHTDDDSPGARKAHTEAPLRLEQGLLERAVLAVASECDGAASMDGMGFSSADAAWFAPHIEAARSGGCITASLRRRVTTRLEKYAGQLMAAGININRLVDEEETRSNGEEDGPAEGRLGGLTLKPPSIGMMLSSQERWLYHLGQLHIYMDGHYKPEGERIARAKVQALLGDAATIKAGNEVAYWLNTQHYQAPEAVDAGSVVNVGNGLLDALTGELLPHSPDHLSTIRLPVAWNPEAYHKRFDEFLDEVLPDKATRHILEEALGYLLVSDCRYEKAVMLTGDGENGKSVFLTALEALLGKANISNIKLQDVGERFTTAQLVGKLANVFADLPKDALQDTGIFKMLVSGDSMKAERKHKDPFEFRNRAKLWFSANEIPMTRDKTRAFWRRWIIVPFPNSFPEGHPKRDPGLKAKLTEPAAQAYLLRLAVEGLRRLVARGHFIESDATRHALDTYKTESDNLRAFIDEALVVKAGAIVSKDELYKRYREWCEAAGLRSMNKLTLGKELHRLIPALSDSKPSIHGKREHCWSGIGLLDEHPDHHATPPNLLPFSVGPGSGQVRARFRARFKHR